jgi:hypothetical protein
METETRSTSAERVRAHRKRRKYGQFLRTITVTKGELERLEERGYLSSNDRGVRRRVRGDRDVHHGFAA